MNDFWHTGQQTAMFRNLSFVLQRNVNVPHMPSNSELSHGASNNNNDFLCANILEHEAQWRAKIMALTNLVIVNNAPVVSK